VLIYAALCLIVILLLSSIRQYFYDRKVARTYQPVGEFAAIGDTDIHYVFREQPLGNFTFVLVAGLGETHHTWTELQDSLLTMGHVFLYDRAGLGFSTAGKQPRSSRQLVRELKQTLTAAKVPGPYILVGHSIGGAHIRMFSHLYPEVVAGLVLIDPSHEKMIKDVPHSFGRALYLFVLQHLAWSGIPYALLPEPPHPIYKTAQSISTYGQEMAAVEESAEQFFQADMDLSHLPIYILSVSKEDTLFQRQASGYYQELIDASAHEVKKWIAYEGKPHHLHRSDPAIVAAEIREFVARLQLLKA